MTYGVDCVCNCPAILSTGGMVFIFVSLLFGGVIGVGFRELTNWIMRIDL